MINIEINYLEIILAAVLNMILGMLWYGPILGKVWIKEMNISKKDIEKAQKQGMTKNYIASMIASLIIACSLSIIFSSIQTTLLESILISILIWFGFVASIMLNSILWEGKSVKLYLINSSYYLVSLILMSIILNLL